VPAGHGLVPGTPIWDGRVPDGPASDPTNGATSGDGQAPGAPAAGDATPGGPGWDGTAADQPGGHGAPSAAATATPARTTRRRPGTKRARLCAMLATLAADDPRSTYALAKVFAPLVGLHEGTARRYIAEERPAL
jgi:hypothetical protein